MRNNCSFFFLISSERIQIGVGLPDGYGMLGSIMNNTPFIYGNEEMVNVLDYKLTAAQTKTLLRKGWTTDISGFFYHAKFENGRSGLSPAMAWKIR